MSITQQKGAMYGRRHFPLIVVIRICMYVLKRQLDFNYLLNIAIYEC